MSDDHLIFWGVVALIFFPAILALMRGMIGTALLAAVVIAFGLLMCMFTGPLGLLVAWPAALWIQISRPSYRQTRTR